MDLKLCPPLQAKGREEGVKEEKVQGSQHLGNKVTWQGEWERDLRSKLFPAPPHLWRSLRKKQNRDLLLLRIGSPSPKATSVGRGGKKPGNIFGCDIPGEPVLKGLTYGHVFITQRIPVLSFDSNTLHTSRAQKGFHKNHKSLMRKLSTKDDSCPID